MKFDKSNARRWGRLGGLASGAKRREKSKKAKIEKIYEQLKQEHYTGYYRLDGFLHEFADGKKISVYIDEM